VEIHPTGSSRRKTYEEESSKERGVVLPADSLVKKRCCNLQEDERILFYDELIAWTSKTRQSILFLRIEYPYNQGVLNLK